ncbi:hypothetical protein BRC88_05080 [Halobacteriales archaeon QS_4_69_225]|nr:MAG: hypothetical protein BRC88_05080 [Halobacteriales archaeon QS_4_69_225]
MDELADLAAEVRAAREVDVDAFAGRVEREADRLKAELAVGTFDNPDASVGLEHEFYAVDARDRLRRVPVPLLELVGFEKELGRHNAEMAGRPQPFGPHGLAALRHEMQASVRSARDAASRAENVRLVADGFWTVPPVGETAADYLGAHAEFDGLDISPNIPPSARYHVMSNTSVYESRCRLETANVTLETPTIAPATLTASIQPHYQVPVAAALPTYFNYALRAAGPLLALAANSPLFPPSLYDADATVESVLADGHRENRVELYEAVMNDPDRPAKVRFPRDLDGVEAAVDRVAADPPIAPELLDDGGDRFDDAFAHLRHKHGSYWRWVRPVFDGATPAAANARIEFRPLPGQPTVPDAAALVATVAGLLRGLVATDHPVATLSWERARDNFYAAAREGLDADLAWVTADGTETTDTDALYADLFAVAAEGLDAAGVDGADRHLDRLRARIEARRSPAGWKRDRLRAHAADGAPLPRAVTAAARDYLDAQRGTLLEGSFADWLAP